MSKRSVDFEGQRILRLPEVMTFTGLRRTALLEMIAANEFPRPIKLSDSGRAVGWDEAELIEWKKARMAARDRRAA